MSRKKTFLLFCLLNFTLTHSVVINSICNKNTRWTKGHGDPIQSFLDSITQNLETDDSTSHLIATFDHRRGSSSSSSKATSIASVLPFKPIRGWKRFKGGGGDRGHEENDGWIFGSFADFGEGSGDDLVFVYDDFRTVLRGWFENGIMVRATRAKIKGYRCLNGIMQIQTTRNNTDLRTYRYDPANSNNNNVLSRSPTLMDPLEQTNVVVAKNQASPSEEVLFARRRIPAFRTVSFYNGLPRHFRGHERFLFPNLTSSEVSESLRRHLVFDRELQLDVVPSDADVVAYRASLAHLANYLWGKRRRKDEEEKINSMVGVVNHPRFGRIPCLVALRDIERGEEILVHHDYEEKESSIYRTWWNQKI